MKVIKQNQQSSSPKSRAMANCTRKSEMEGYLFMQNQVLWKFPMHTWKRRYFVLENDFLYFTKDVDEKVSLMKTAKIQIDADTGIYPEDSQRGRFYLRITQGKQNYLLYTNDLNERNTWLNALLTIITRKYVVHFKSGAYKSLRLNYRRSSDVPNNRNSSYFRGLSAESLKKNMDKVIPKSISMFTIKHSDEGGTKTI